MLARAAEIARDADLEAGEWALDVGGGYGRHAAQWRSLGIRPVVVDPSAAMRSRASQTPGLTVVGGRGEALPFADRSAGLWYAHLSIHYCDADRAVDEACRVVRRGGSIAIGTLGPRHHRRSFLSQWFPSIAHNDEGRFPDPAHIAGRLATNGATDVRLEQVDVAKTRPAGRWRDAVLAGFVSSLQFIAAAELAAGLEAFDRSHPDPEEPIAYVIRYDWVRASR